MSEREPGLGSFILGVALGVTLGLLFAPEGGEAFRDRIARRLRALRGLAAERADDLGVLLLEAPPPEADDHTGTSRRRSRRRRPQPGEEDA